MLDATAGAAITTLDLVTGVRGQMAAAKQLMRDRLPRAYSQDLLNNLFRHPYTRIEFVVSDLGVSRQTVAKYPDALAGIGFVEKHQAGRSKYYINVNLVHLLYDLSN